MILVQEKIFGVLDLNAVIFQKKTNVWEKENVCNIDAGTKMPEVLTKLK